MSPLSRRAEIAHHLRTLFPKAPDKDLRHVLDAAEGSRGLRQASPPTAAWLSAVAYIRHALSEYDTLLAEGYDVDSARHFSLPKINEILMAWGAARQIRDAPDDHPRIGSAGSE